MNSLSRNRWNGQPGDLTRLLTSVVSCSVRFLNQMPIAITFWNDQGGAITVQTEMIDLAPRVEVGVMVLSIPAHRDLEAVEVKEGEFFGKPLELFGLLIEECGEIVESGLCLRFGSHESDELIVVAGAFPYSIAIAGLSSQALPRFAPEYPLERYQRVPLGRG